MGAYQVACETPLLLGGFVQIQHGSEFMLLKCVASNTHRTLTGSHRPPVKASIELSLLPLHLPNVLCEDRHLWPTCNSTPGPMVMNPSEAEGKGKGISCV